MSVEDRLAIQEAIARYSHTYDSKDADAFAQLFVEDGILEVIVPGESSPTVRLSSRAAKTASARTMLLLTRQGAPDAAPLLHLTGIYHDRWRKTREGWRLVHRAARVDRDPGYAKH